MNSHSKLSYAITAILSGSASGYVYAAPAAETAATDEGIAEITVTAQRRAENMQDVPITIQALTGETLKQLNVTTFDDFVKYLPNVTQASQGPGMSSIFMRGLGAGITGQQGTGTTGPMPNVAVYLDDQSGALPGRNLDIYAADLERIEVLEGPQGTLFGSGAEAGVLRYITNKPKLDVTEGNVNAGYGFTSHGDPNTNVDAMLNIPLISDTLALRAVIFRDERGGYINNVPATFTRYATDEGFTIHNGGVLPTNNVSINNNQLVQSGINPLSYQGFRLSALWKINDHWDALLSQNYQTMNAQGVFYQQPFGPEGLTFNAKGEPVGARALPPLSVTVFNPSYDKDRFENTALTVNGQIGDLKVVYSGSYLVRNVEQVQDYTNYARGVYGYYYQCAGYSKHSAAAGQCFSPSSTWQDKERNTHQSHELRVTTPDDARVRGIGGIYWEEYKIYDDTEWLYKTVPTCTATYNDNCFNNVQPWPGAPSNNPGVKNDNVGFFDDVQRTIIQKAAFASVDFDIIPKTLILTAGTRYYKFTEDELGGAVGSFYCKNFAPTTYFGPCTAAGLNNPKAPYGADLTNSPYNNSTYHGFKSRANLSWHVDSDILLYYTWSQGFRPGGFNRGGKQVVPDANGIAQYIVPYQYSPDQLTNNELGFKTQWLNHRLEVNGAVYQEDWKNAIVEFFDPQGGFGNLTFVTNGPDYRVRGFELSIIGKPTEGITLQGSMSRNWAEQANSPFLIDNNPKSPGYNLPITSVPNVFGPQGTVPPTTPALQWNARIRDDIPLGDYKAFWQFGVQHISNENSGAGTVDNYLMPGYTTYDASVGVAKDAWTVQLFSQNLTDVNASTFTNSFQFIRTETVLRPRTGGVKFSYKF